MIVITVWAIIILLRRIDDVFILLSINELYNWPGIKYQLEEHGISYLEVDVLNQNSVMANIVNDDPSTLNSYLRAIKSK